ncbi:putative pinoresinol-lariciresinol reductase 3 [Nymphaea thermarum]|nr:putative pinoresinol-lariciresinol reductase 3 [Nymphaea thermarum]
MESKSRVLIVGVTGRLGRHLAEASLSSGHPTYALVRPTTLTSSPEKSQLLQSLVSSGLQLVQGSLEDYPVVVETIKQVDVVISALGSFQIMDQKNIIRAIKEAGCVKRFIPSEFGSDPEKIRLPDPSYTFHAKKSEIRRIIREEGIPFTFISCNYFATFLLPSLVQPGLKCPPRDKVFIYGDGNTKAIFVKEEDVAAFTIKAMDDTRTLNKTVYLRPPGNIQSFNEIVQLWEEKIGKTLEKIYVPEEQVLKIIEENPYPSNLEMVFIYSAFIKGDHIYFSIKDSGVEATELYPDQKYTTIREYLDTLL